MTDLAYTLTDVIDAEAHDDSDEVRRLSREKFDAPWERVYLWEQAGRRCEWVERRKQGREWIIERCEQTFPTANHCQLDHIFPHTPADGGPMGVTDAESNGSALCAWHNGRAHKWNKVPEPWYVAEIFNNREPFRLAQRKAK